MIRPTLLIGILLVLIVAVCITGALVMTFDALFPSMYWAGFHGWRAWMQMFPMGLLIAFLLIPPK